MNPFTGPEWEGWKVNVIPREKTCMAVRWSGSMMFEITATKFGDYNLVVEQAGLSIRVNRTTLELALKAANAIAEAVGGWE
jgi:hypothetical protein